MERILSSILGPVCQRVIDAAIQEYISVRDVKKEIRKLRTTVDMIKRVLEDAERKKDDRCAIREWLKSLKQVLFDAEDVFDEIATDEALGRDAKDGTSRLSKVRKLIPGVDISLSSHAIAHRVKNINKKFVDISKDKDMLGLQVSKETSESVVRPTPNTSSLLSIEARIIGRDNEMRKLKELLLEYSTEGTVATTSDNYKNVHVISVVGIGGVGKTTLVQHAYNSPAVTEYFHPRIWVCTSNNFDVKIITGEIMEAAEFNSKKTRDKFADTSNWDVVQKSLQDKLEGKRFMLVLDDVWEEDPSKWDSLCTPLMYGGKGSKIIVTTRSQKVASITKGTPIFLKDLPSDDLWSIFQTYAFDGHDPDKDKQLVILGRKIVDQLKGSPLAARTIGRLLHSNLHERHWRNIMKMSLDFKNSILPILKLSYDHLPGHLKQCFAYCSLFPEDYPFDKDELVQLWMAQQFIPIREDFFHVESMGEEYFDDLVCMSLFEKWKYDQERFVMHNLKYNLAERSSNQFKMHDLIHDLAESISEDDCFRLGDDKQKQMSENVRHVSIDTYSLDSSKLMEILNHENLRTLVFLRHQNTFKWTPLLDDLLMKLKRLRVLGLQGCNIDELPSSIGKLKHLRFVDLSKTPIRNLPDSMSKLHNLQVLKLKGCEYLHALPQNTSALVNLRHLELDTEIASYVPRLGKLTALQELILNGSEVGELADMGMLKELRIWDLDGVASVEEAVRARLEAKKHLELLELYSDEGIVEDWRCQHSVSEEEEIVDDSPRQHSVSEEEEIVDDSPHQHSVSSSEEIVDALKPVNCIRQLSVSFYMGARWPKWMGDPSWVSTSLLVKVELCDCPKWEVLPPFGQLPCLKFLAISGMWGVRRIGPEFFFSCCCDDGEGGVKLAPGFPSLEELKFRGMPEWEEWETPVVLEQQQHPLFFPRLRTLRLETCWKLRELPPLPPTLTTLHLDRVGLTRLPGWMERCSHDIGRDVVMPSTSTSSSPSLSTLEISICPNITSLDDGFLQRPLRMLKSLRIYRCVELASLPDGLFRHLESLESLRVTDCPKLSWAPSAATEEDAQSLITYNSLKSLSISNCSAITTLPSSTAVLRGLRSLERLKIEDCGELRSLGAAAGLVSLECLILRNCPELLHLVEEGAAAVRSSPSASSPVIPSSSTVVAKISVKTLWAPSCSPKQIATWLRQVSSLQLLVIWDCPKLRCFGAGDDDDAGPGDDDTINGGDLDLEGALLDLAPSLRELRLVNCENLSSLPSKLRSLTSLERLKIEYCPKIRRLPSAGLPETLKELVITGCPELEQRCREEGCPDWPLLSHIPSVQFRAGHAPTGPVSFDKIFFSMGRQAGGMESCLSSTCAFTS